MDFRNYYYYVPVNFYETPEMVLIDHEPNGDSVTDDGTFTDTEVMEMLSSFGYRANHVKYTRALDVIARFPPFDYLAYSDEERDAKTPEGYR